MVCDTDESLLEVAKHFYDSLYKKEPVCLDQIHKFTVVPDERKLSKDEKRVLNADLDAEEVELFYGK